MQADTFSYCSRNRRDRPKVERRLTIARYFSIHHKSECPRINRALTNELNYFDCTRRYGNGPRQLNRRCRCCASATCQNSSLMAIRIGMAIMLTCAAPSYLRKCGEPMTLEDLNDQRGVNFLSEQNNGYVPIICCMGCQYVGR